MAVHINSDWGTVSILWYALDGAIFLAALFAYGIAKLELAKARAMQKDAMRHKG